jgi:pyridoxal phosphate enzyme (YggS family)
MTIAERIKTVSNDVAAAAIAAGRDPNAVKLVAVSKTHPPGTVREAIEAGATVFGENKVQEGLAKIEDVGREGIEWHLIGHLQKNKVRKAVLSFDVIQTVDSLKLAKRLDRIAGEELSKPLRVFAQIDLAGEDSKFGITEEELGNVVGFLAEASNLKFEGLMAIPPYFVEPEDVRPYFRRLREIRDGLRESGVFSSNGGDLSMGMSHDFAVAIEEGATVVRIGTAIFGARQQIAI